MKPAIVVFVVFLSCVSASPSPLRPRVDCTNTDPESFYDPTCWSTLDLTNWLTNWKQPKVCNSSDDGVGCCRQNEEWSTCFLRIYKADSGLNCSQIAVNTNDCAYNAALAPNLDASIKPQVRYVLRTIFNINAFFNNWYTALQYATTQTSLTIDPIITTVDPAKSMSISMTDVLSALIAGLPFIGAPIGATALETSKAAQALVTGIQQAPGLAKSLWPTSGTAESQLIQISNLDTALKNANQQLGDRINAGLWNLMSSQSSFASFASSGAFTGDPKLTIPQNLQNINNALTLFVLTKALSGNKYEAELIQTSNIVPGTDFCHYPNYDNKGTDLCWHNTTIFGGVIGRLRKTDANDGKKGPGMQQKVLQAGWATDDTLIGAGWRCARSGKFGQTVADLGPDGKLAFDCLNQIRQCYSGTLKGCSDYVGGNCPIGKCDP